jgi:hypothetical protein
LISKQTYANEPLEILSLKAGGQRVSLDSEFFANADWLKDLSLEVQNTSGKPIIAIQINLIVKVQGRALPAGLPLNYGWIRYSLNHNEREKIDTGVQPLAPGAKITLALQDRHFKDLRNKAKTAEAFSEIDKGKLNQTNKDVDTRSRRHSPFSTLNSQFFCSEQPAW